MGRGRGKKTSIEVVRTSRDTPGEDAKKTSGRQTGGSYLAIKFSGDEFGPKDLRLALACGWLNIQLQKSMKDVVSEEGHQQKALDRFGIMLEDMIGVPFVDQFVEGIILDIPSLVPPMDDSLDRSLGSR